MRRIEVGEATFDLGDEFARLTGLAGPRAGGIGCFVGVVRGGITAMTLEHYPGMTERAIDEIAASAEQRFGLAGCTIIHRVGRLLPGEAIVLVLAAARHRGEALDATRFIIDWLKTRAPFWKREEALDGRVTWTEPQAIDEQAAEGWGAAPDPAGAGGPGPA